MRRICQHCGAKRNIDQLEPVAKKIGSYFQSGKNEITLYICKKARRKSTDYEFVYCNGSKDPPEVYMKGRWHNY